MANVSTNSRKFRLDTAGNVYILPAQHGFMGVAAVALVSNAAVGASITVVARPACKEATEDGANIAFQNWWYETAAGAKAQTAITGAALFYVPVGGMEVGLSLTALTSGTLDAYVSYVQGPAF